MFSDKRIEDEQAQLSIPFGGKLAHLLTPDEIYQAANSKLLGDLLEDRRVERKPATVGMPHLAEYFSMWANTTPFGGLIVVGYRKDNILEGCISFGQDKINEIERCGKELCPDARYDIRRIAITNYKDEDDFVMLIRVPYREDKLVKTVSGHAFVRWGASKHELNLDEMREIEIDKGQVSFELERCNLPYPRAFDTELIEMYCSNYTKSRSLNEHDREEILKLSHLGEFEGGKFEPNNACALLFAIDPQGIFSGSKIRFLRYSGEQERTGVEWNVEKDVPIDRGSIPRILAEAEKVVGAQLRTFSRLEKDGRFYTAPEYPSEAWYEAIVNACVHRSYEQRTMTVFVKMFDDRLVIESPGGFPPFVTPNNIYEMSKPRNPHIMNALFYFDLVKCANEGTRRMRNSMKGLGLADPEFEEKQLDARVVRVTLRNDVKNRRKWIEKSESDVLGKEVWTTLNENERKIVNYLAEYETASVSTLVKVTSLSWPTCRKLLKGLKNRGIAIDIRKRDADERDPQARWKLDVKSKK